MTGWAAALVLVASAAGAWGQATNLQQAMSQIDAASAKFQDVEANFTADLYTAVVQTHEMQKGTTAFRRAGSAMEMFTKIETDNDQPAERDLLYKNGELDDYTPAMKQEMIIAAGSNRDEFDSLLATGFGATSKGLNSAWTVAFQGMESVGGTQAAKLDLVPKQQSIRNNVSHLTIWVDLNRDISLKQVMFQPEGDTRTVIYSNIRYNTHLPASLFTLHVPGGTQVQRR